MAVNFGILSQGPSIGERFIQGQEAAEAASERNRLREMQMMQMDAQRENILAQREQRMAQAQDIRAKQDRAAERQQFLTGLNEQLAQGGYKLDRPTLGKVLQFGMQSGEDSLIQYATKGLQALDEEDLYQRETQRLGLGGVPAPAPANAMAPSAEGAAPAPVNALAQPGVNREMVQRMVMSPSPRVRAQGEALRKSLPEEFAQPEIVRLQQYLGQLTPGSAEYTAVQDRIKMLTTRPEPAKTVVNLPPQQSAFEAGLGKGQATQVMENKTVAEDARSIIDTVAQGRQLLQSGVITGFGADYLTKFGAALNQAGINFAEDKVANTQAFAANMAQNVGRIIKQFGAGTGLSNADREYAEKMAGGNISLDRKALERILDINERAARNVIRLHNKNVSGIKTNIPLTVEEPPVTAPAAPAGRPPLDAIFKPK
jgi:hypothetical protein